MAYTFASPHNSMPGGEQAQIHFVQDIEWHAMRHWTDALVNIAWPPQVHEFSTIITPSAQQFCKVCHVKKNCKRTKATNETFIMLAPTL